MYKHHVIPFHEWKSRINPNVTRYDRDYNASDNVVWLTLEQHIQAHELLYELNGSEYDRLAALMMSGKISKGDVQRMVASEYMKGNQHAKGKKMPPHTPERRQAQAERIQGNSYRLGKTFSEESRKKISDTLRGVKHSLERNLRKSERMRGKAQKRIECPNCHKVGGIPGMKRYHFDNCKKGMHHESYASS